MINDYEATKPIIQDATTGSGQESEYISRLNGLIEVCKDGQEGFREAAEGSTDPALKSFFREQSLTRSKFAGDLQALVQTLGGEPENSGTFTGSIRRGWMNIKAAVTGNDDAAILSECEKSEDAAKDAYKDVLKAPLPDYVGKIVQTQYAGILTAHDRVKTMRDNAKGRGSAASSR